MLRNRALPGAIPPPDATSTGASDDHEAVESDASDGAHDNAYDDDGVRDNAYDVDAGNQFKPPVVSELPTTPGKLFVEFLPEMTEAEGTKKAKVIKQSSLLLFKRMDRVVVPADWTQETPTSGDLHDKLIELYKAQTFLIDSYSEVAPLLRKLGNMKLAFGLVTIRDPTQFDFGCLTLINMLGSNKAGCLVRLPPMKSLTRDHVVAQILSVFWF